MRLRIDMRTEFNLKETVKNLSTWKILYESTEGAEYVRKCDISDSLVFWKFAGNFNYNHLITIHFNDIGFRVFSCLLVCVVVIMKLKHFFE